MPDKFIIRGGKPLEGTVEIGGYKNAAGPILAATLLTSEECIISNLPLVEDAFVMLKVLEDLGVNIQKIGKRRFKIKAGDNLDPEKMNLELVGKARISVLLIGGLISRFKNFKISRPGGDRIGLRPISTHTEALKKMGVIIQEKGDIYQFKTKNLLGCEVVLKEFSVTATENLMMAAVLSSGTTIIKGAAAEPQVQDLGKMLNSMGAKIKGKGTHTIVIKGVKKLHGTNHKIISDPLESGTFIVAGAITPGQVQVKNVILGHLDLFLDKLEEIGVILKKKADSVFVDYSPKLKAVKIQALPYPGFPTDLLPITLPLLTQAEGKSLVHDPLYENRLNYIQELRKMEADIEIVDPHRAFVFGSTPLRGVTIESWDIRAGASLVIAALLAKGKTTIHNIRQIDRGYEKIEEKLQGIGADIKRVTS